MVESSQLIIYFIPVLCRATIATCTAITLASHAFFLLASQDYVGLTEEIFPLDCRSPIFTVYITIVDDDILEANETFKAVLGLVYRPRYGRVIFQPSEAEVYILDNDSKSITFFIQSSCMRPTNKWTCTGLVA